MLGASPIPFIAGSSHMEADSVEGEEANRDGRKREGEDVSRQRWRSDDPSSEASELADDHIGNYNEILNLCQP